MFNIVVFFGRNLEEHFLRIKDVRLEDQGIYICQVSKKVINCLFDNKCARVVLSVSAVIKVIIAVSVASMVYFVDIYSMHFLPPPG